MYRLGGTFAKHLCVSWRQFIWIVAISIPYLWVGCVAAIVESTRMSTLLADTVHHFLENLRNEQQSQQSENVQAEESSLPQTRGGYGGGHGGGGGHGHGAITLDPVSIISLLALGAFLINNILQLLRANMGNNMAGGGGGGGGGAIGGGRSFSALNLENLVFPPPPSFNGWNNSGVEPSFMNFFENVGSLYYLQPKKRHLCMKRVVCEYNNLKQGREQNANTLKTKIFDFMLSTITKIVAPEIDDPDKEEKCHKAQKFCSDSLLKDARVSIEYKIYSQVSSWITKLAFNGLASG